ncbi:family 10 glycosylhydrolase [Paenibacillus sp. LHD-38]|uniref:family 10 glycosylhydrolase n=1 Tax=Paenibacillus sp. LHD-38 TaxID=3072143 RepID=UPI00280E9B70|nr:family 10 glycosylhydrolase [Paenibacillus sp. LHD-38]MDQ8738050.1 family 10 glycosylhydrolase [Paenibacillus sp. LHD-38]
MKIRKWSILLLLAVICLSAAAPVGQAAEAAGIRIILNGKVIESEVAPYILPKVNITMVPLRVISEELKASVTWSSAERRVTIKSSGNKTITMDSGSTAAIVNGESVKLDASVQVKAGRAMVPLRFVSEQLGLTVNWSQSNKTITLLSGGITPPAPDPDPNGDPEETEELRGAWVSTVYNLDWPSSASYLNEVKQMGEFVSLLDDLQSMGMNAVFVQVRPAGDAFYPSDLVPWSKYLSGVQGLAPSYDPLAFMIEEAHKRNMEFHAWFNPFRASVDNKTDQLAANHVTKQHPDWIVNAGGKLYINPGIPEARQHIIDTIMEVVNGYAVDGVHLDDYFYPSNIVFADDSAFQAYNPAKIAAKADWRRSNINEFVRQLGESIHKANPKVKYGISPFGVWRNKAVDKTGSDTKASITAYDDMYADVRTWIQRGWVDYITPQIYWSLSFTAARYDKLVDWWAQEVKGTDVDLYIGHSPYKLGTKEAGWQSAQEMINQLKYNKKYAEIKGDVFFSAKDLRKNTLGIMDELRTYYSE